MNDRALAAAVALIALSAGACTAGTDKSGGQITPTTLVMASNDGTKVSSPAVARFVELVDQKSHGSLEIELSPAWAAKGEQRVLEDVAAGKATLGWSGTRAFDLIGADAFQPLHAPFLIGSYEAERAVVRDGVAQNMLETLSGSGLTGLALLADELRFPAGAEGPLVDAGDFDDLAFGVMSSKIQATAISSLGARVTQFSAPGTGTDGLEGLETMWWTYTDSNQQAIAPFVTANAVLWPRTSVIVANTDALSDLDSADRDVLTRAATEAARWSLDHADDKVDDEITKACLAGARIATATPAQLATLTKAAQPTYAALRADPEQAALLARVEQLVRSAGPSAPISVPAGCAYRPGDEGSRGVVVLPRPLSHAGEPGRLPAGTYRFAITQDEIERGAPHTDPAEAAANAGVWTWTLKDGRWRYDLKPSAKKAPEGFAGNTCGGYYDVHGTEVDFTTLTTYEVGECAPPTWKAVWRRTENGLRMHVTAAPPGDLDILYGSKIWERID